jgi:hypothetical protein
MKSMNKITTAAIVVASLAGISAMANPITGSIWENQPTAASDATTANVPSTPADVTFSTTAPINFSSGSLYTIGEFLASGTGSTVLTGSGQLGNTLDNTIFNFLGQVTVTSGETFTAGHDDGLTLIIDGIPVIAAPGGTSFVDTTETYTGPSGTWDFQLVYGECCGAPAALAISLPLQNAPDSGSTMALLGGALTMMGVVARRFRK